MLQINTNVMCRIHNYYLSFHESDFQSENQNYGLLVRSGLVGL